MTVVLRRLLAKRATTTPVASDLSADLVADIVAMTRQATLDGLPLSAVLDDLRLVLQLEPTDVLPVEALRACALEWARTITDPEAALRTVPVTLDDLEGHMWSLLGTSPADLPGRIVVVRLRPSEPDDETSGAGPSDVLDSADLLGAAARLMSHFFDRPGEHVAVLRSPPAAVGDRVVALVAGPHVGDGSDDEDRMALFKASLASSPVTGLAAWVVEVHDLVGHPGGLIAGIREALEPD